MTDPNLIQDDFPGGALDLPDPRDHQADHILGAAPTDNLPASFRLDIREGNQGAVRETKVACTCFSACHVAQTANEKEHGSPLEPEFLQMWELQGKFGTRSVNGDYVQTALKSIVKNGLLVKGEKVYPITGYAEVKKADLKARIAEGHAIVTSATVTSTNFKKAKSEGTWGGNDGIRVTGHAFALVGYKPGFFIASNSYGPDWGFFKDGTFLISEMDVQFLGTCYLLYDAPDLNYLYKDVTNLSEAYEDIKWAKEEGLMLGYLDGRFGPTDSLTRAQMAILMRRLVNYLDKRYNK